MVEIVKNNLKQGHRVRPGKALKYTTITIHSTGNPSSSANSERRWLDNPDNNREASWHYCVDEHEIVEAIPPTEVAWHAGSGNSSSIGIEICESGNREKTLENAAEFVASLLKANNWGVDKLKRHYDWTQKSCPAIMMKNNWAGWSDFKKRVQKYLDKSNGLKVVFDDKVITVDGFIKEGRTYIQMREICEMLGCKVGYENGLPTIQTPKQ